MATRNTEVNQRAGDGKSQPDGCSLPSFLPKPPRLWHGVVALFAGSFLAYAPALSGEPIWDDTFLVGSNPLFRSPLFLLEVFRHWLFTDSLSTYYRPVQNISYQVDYLIWQGNPFGYHFTNIMLHGAVAALLFLLLLQLFTPDSSRSQSVSPGKTYWIAFSVAALWVVHPVHNAAVAYMAGRADSLAALFALGGWLVFLRSDTQHGLTRISGLAAAWGAGLLALCSKEIAITWIVLFTAVQLRGTLRRKLSILGMLALLFASYWVLRHLPEPRSAPIMIAESFPARIILMLRALGDYTGLIFWPAELHMGRVVWTPKAYANAGSWQAAIGYEYLSLLGAGTLAVLGFGLRGCTPGVHLRRLGALWFLIGFLPVSNLFPLNAQVAEHWIYMPSIGYLLFLAGCFIELPCRWQKPLIILIAMAGIAFTVRSRIRSEDWTSPERFYLSAVQARIEDPRLLVNLANLYLNRGELARAEAMLKSILEQWPDYGPANIQLGNVLMAQGRKTASEPYRRAAEDTPTSWQARVKLAEIEGDQGKRDNALEIIDSALRSKPDVDDLIQMKVHYLVQAGRSGEALAVARDHGRKVWWSPAAQELIARLCFSNGEPDAALDALRRAAWLDIWASKPLMVAAQVELSRNRPAEALAFAKKAAWRDPGTGQYLLLAKVYRQLGHESEASDAMQRAGQLHASGSFP